MRGEDLIRKRAADHERFHRWTYGGSAYDDRRALLVEVDRLRDALGIVQVTLLSDSADDPRWHPGDYVIDVIREALDGGS